MSKAMNVTLLGAGGKMGGRVTANLRNLSRYKIDYVEASEERRKEMATDLYCNNASPGGA